MKKAITSRHFLIVCFFFLLLLSFKTLYIALFSNYNILLKDEKERERKKKTTISYN